MRRGNATHRSVTDPFRPGGKPVFAAVAVLTYVGVFVWIGRSTYSVPKGARTANKTDWSHQLTQVSL